MDNERYNGWRNYATWRVNLECFDGWQGELTPDTAAELVEGEIELSSQEGIAREYALAFIAQVDWYEIAIAHCPSYAEEWRRAFSKAFYNHTPEGFDADIDAQTPNPWAAPWIWAHYEEWALDEDPAIAAQKFAEYVRSDIERELASDKEYEEEGGTL